MRAVLRAGGEVEGSAMHQQLTWLVSQYVQVRLGRRMPPHIKRLCYWVQPHPRCQLLSGAFEERFRH